jgi:hypothetical protein
MTNEMAKHELRKAHLLGGVGGWGSRHRLSFWARTIYSNCLAIKKKTHKEKHFVILHIFGHRDKSCDKRKLNSKDKCIKGKFVVI